MPSLVRTALIGCGSLGRLVHLPILRRLPASRLIAIADPDSAALDAAARIVPDATTFSDHRELLARADIDAIIVALPTALHAPVGMEVLASRKHLYLEKPIGVTLREGEQLVECWRMSDRVGIIGFNYRFHPLYRRLRDLIATGAIGSIVAVRTVFGAAKGAMPEWKLRRDSGGGALLDLGIHHLDLLRFLLGSEVRTVGSQLHAIHSEDDRVSLDVELDRDVVAQMLFAFGAVEEDRVEVYGDAGKLTVDRHYSVDVEYRPARVGSSRAARLGIGSRGPSLRAVIGSPVLSQRLRAPLAEPSFAASLENFVAAASGARVASPDLADGLRALEIADAAIRSALEGKRVAATRPAVGLPAPRQTR